MFLLCEFLMCFFLILYLCFSLPEMAKNTHCPEDRHKVTQFTTTPQLTGFMPSTYTQSRQQNTITSLTQLWWVRKLRQCQDPLKRKRTKPRKLPAVKKSSSTSPPPSDSPPHAEEGQESGESASVSPISHELV